MFVGRDKELRTGKVLPSDLHLGIFATNRHPISGKPMLQIEVVEGPDVGAIYWILADKVDDTLGMLGQIL